MAEPDRLHQSVLSGLRHIGYDDSLLIENYKFPDFFSHRVTRHISAAAFGQSPPSYATSCIGVVRPNGLRGEALVDQCRSLGSPVVLEVDENSVQEWAVSRQAGQHRLVKAYAFDEVNQLFIDRAVQWRPDALLRAKSIGDFDWTPHLNLFSGLIPELEEEIQLQLGPLLHSALSAASGAYKAAAHAEPNEDQLFKLVFLLLTAKVFADRDVNGFQNLNSNSDPEIVLKRIANRYGVHSTRLLNQQARQAAFNRIWIDLDFRNLSVEVLSQIWATTLISDETRDRLGIHRTPRSLVSYITSRISYLHHGDDVGLIVEPCSGSAVFLIGGMQELRQRQALFGMTPQERHKYFSKHLVGVEVDPFSIELSRMALTLADFPNPSDWRILPTDVFERDTAFKDVLQQASIVFCNPPFEAFNPREIAKYSPTYTQKPAELLHFVLQNLNPRGQLGWVLPRTFVDGIGAYAELREALARRFAKLQIAVLPDRAFEADTEVALLIATDPVPHRTVSVSFSKVRDNAESWAKFEATHEVSSTESSDLSIPQARNSLSIPTLRSAWRALEPHTTLGEIASIRRGIEWNKPLTRKGKETGNRKSFVRDRPVVGFMLGVAPRTSFSMFEVPQMKYLSVRPEDARTGAYKHDWKKPKAIINKATRSRGAWRIAAFADSVGVTCYQTYTAFWPQSHEYDEVLLAAILNSPIANAFIATREGKTDNTSDVLRRIPVPYFTADDAKAIRSSVTAYRRAIEESEQQRLLLEIDAIVTASYRLSPKIEQEILHYFDGAERTVNHEFGDYIPDNDGVYFSLRDRLADKFEKMTASSLLERMKIG